MFTAHVDRTIWVAMNWERFRQRAVGWVADAVARAAVSVAATLGTNWTVLVRDGTYTLSNQVM